MRKTLLKLFTFQFCVLHLRTWTNKGSTSSKSDLKEAFGLIIQEYPNAGDFVSNIGRNLGLKYPELLAGDDE